MTTREEHPVWGVYDLLRTARLNVKYYSGRLALFQRWNFALELVLAITAPSSAVAGLWFWDTAVGAIAWKVLGVFAAAAAVLKPLLGLDKRIGAYTELAAGYRTLDHDLYELKELIAQRRSYGKDLQLEFQKALKRKGALVSKDPETRPSEKLKRECVSAVKRELPPEAFYVPGE